MTDTICTVSEAAERTGESPRTIQRRIDDGTLDAVKKAGVWIIDQQSLKAYVEDQERERIPA
jgi:excisionase family DNA binding protein